jgi:hypothetical protein
MCSFLEITALGAAHSITKEVAFSVANDEIIQVSGEIGVSCSWGVGKC